MQSPRSPAAPVGLLCALPEELGGLAERARSRRRVQGLELLEVSAADRPVLACVAGVGKVLAARAATLLLTEGATGGLIVVGVCGAVSAGLEPGTLAHCTTAVQADLAPRPGRETESDPRWRAAWAAVAPGVEARFLTADRPVFSLLGRRRLRRAWPGPAVADMETAAAAAVAAAAGVPWAALRAVTDGADGRGIGAFRRHFPTQAGRAADTALALFVRLAAAPPPREDE